MATLWITTCLILTYQVSYGEESGNISENGNLGLLSRLHRNMRSVTSMGNQECDYPPRPNNGKVEPNNLTGTTNASFTLAQQSCDMGHLSTGGNGHIWCESGKWLGTITCTPIDCGRPPAPTNGNATLMIADQTHYKSTASQSCHLGYKIATGTGTIVCRANRMWDVSITCLKDCGIPPEPEHGKVILTGSEQTFYGSTATQSCNRGYKVAAGNGSITCKENGQWTSIVCLKVAATTTSPSQGTALAALVNSSEDLNTSDNTAGIFSNPAAVAGMSYAAGGITLSPVIVFAYKMVAKRIKVSP